TSSSVDVRPFQGDGLLVAVPSGVDLRLGLKIAQLVAQQGTLEELTGRVHLSGGEARLDAVRGTLFGGTVEVSGRYASPSAEAADVDVSIHVDNVEVQRTVLTFATLRRLVPALEGSHGTMDAVLSIAGPLGRDGAPDLATVSSHGSIVPAWVSIAPTT